MGYYKGKNAIVPVQKTLSSKPGEKTLNETVFKKIRELCIMKELLVTQTKVQTI